MKFIYTEAAVQELQAFQRRQQKLLENLVSDRKFVFGDETVEVTASDIREAMEHIRAYRPRAARYSSFRLVSQVYIILGVGITLGASFYPNIEKIFQENRVQAMAVITGVAMIVVGVFGGYWSRLRARREEEIERKASSHTTEVTSTHFTERLVSGLLDLIQRGVKNNLEWGLNSVSKRVESALNEQLASVNPLLAEQIKKRVLKDLSDTFRTLEYETAAIAQQTESEISQPGTAQAHAAILTPGVPRLIQWIVKHQSKYEFLSVKFLREKLFAGDPPLQEALQFCIDSGILELYDRQNPYAPARPTKACRLNLNHPTTQEVLQLSGGG